MTYHESLWKDAPEGATHWGTGKHSSWTRHGFFGFPTDDDPDALRFWLEQHQAWSSWFTPISQIEAVPRPTAYTPATQLVDQYRKEHWAEIEEWLAGVNKGDDPMKEAEASIWLAARYMALAEYLLAAERARVEGEGK